MNQEMISGIIGAIFGSGISLFSTFLVLRNNVRLEKMRLHGNEKIKYYQKLYDFNRSLNFICRPDSEIVVVEFLELMKKDFSELIFGYPYFSKNILNTLIKLDNLRTCSFIDVDWITPTDKSINENLPVLESKLNSLIINEFKSWTL